MQEYMNKPVDHNWTEDIINEYEKIQDKKKWRKFIALPPKK